MAIINCPNCQKKISNKAAECSHCQLDLKNLDSEKLQRLTNVNKIQKFQSLMNHSFIAMLLFCGGFLVIFLRNSVPFSLEYILSASATIIGFILYIVTRIRLIFLKNKK